MPRVDFIENYIDGVSKNSKKTNIFLLKSDNGIGWHPDYGDRSYETFQKKVKEGKINVPLNVNIIPIDPIIPNTKKPLDYSLNNHAPAIDYGNKMFDRIWNEYKKIK